MLAYIIRYFRGLSVDLFMVASLLTGLAFLLIGWLKGKVNQTNIGRSIVETLSLGLAAAIIAYNVGSFIEDILKGGA